jgi:hypothetical protein
LQCVSLAKSKGVAGDCESEEPVRRGGKLAASIRSYEKKLHIRRFGVGDAAIQAKA